MLCVLVCVAFVLVLDFGLFSFWLCAALACDGCFCLILVFGVFL